MRDLSVPPWVERKRWLVDASWEWPVFHSAIGDELDGAWGTYLLALQLAVDA